MSAEERPQLTEDPGGRAPDVQSADPVAAVSDPPLPEIPLDDLDRGWRDERENGASRIAATSPGDADSAGGRPAIATPASPGSCRRGSTTARSCPRRGAPPRRRRTDLLLGLAERGRDEVVVGVLRAAAGKATSPEWWRPPVDRSMRTTAASSAGVGTTRTRTAAGRASAIVPGHEPGRTRRRGSASARPVARGGAAAGPRAGRRRARTKGARSVDELDRPKRDPGELVN